MQNKLTLLMPTYNRANYITQAVNSVLAQKTNFGIKLIITDDCSTDGTVELIKNLQEKYPEKIEALFSGKNERLLSNILKAQKRVETEYFCVLDPDDYYTDEYFLQKAVDYLEANRDFTIYSSNCMMLFEDNTKKPFIKTKTKSAVFNFGDLLTDRAIITQTAGSVFRNVIYKNGIPEIITNAVGTMSEASFRADTERYIMHLEKGNAYFKNECVAIYRIHKDGIWTKTNQFHRNLLAAQGAYDYFRYFNYRYGEHFLKQSLFYAKLCFSELQKAIDEHNFTQTILPEDVERLFVIITEDEKLIKELNINIMNHGEKPEKIKTKITVKKLIKYILPYGLVKYIQSK